MTDGGIAPAPREQGWTRLVLALAAFLLLPAIPKLRAAPILAQLCAVLPVSSTLILLVPALAACFVAGWWAGGKIWGAIGWSALSAIVLVPRFSFGIAQGLQVDPAYADLVRGWALVVAAAFGALCVLGSARSFFVRALAAAGLAALLTLAVVAFSGGHPGTVEGAFAEHLDRENKLSGAALEALATRLPWLRDWWSVPTATVLPALSKYAAGLYPALMALETLASCAIAWALYHRLSRARIGAPLGALRDFHFSDQLVWGLVAGVTILLLPSLSSLRTVGLNLVAFFGVLFAVRGLGVMAWFVTRRGKPGRDVLWAAAGMVLGWVTLIAAFAIGVGDTCANWRKKAVT